MKKQLLILTATILCFSIIGFSQKAPDADSTKKRQKERRVVIKRATPNKKKVTVVIDGDNVTVNGVPADKFDFDNNEIELYRTDGDNFTINVPQLKERAKVAKGYYFNEIPISATNKALLGVSTEKTDEGAKVIEVSKGNAAEKAGIQEGDIITKLNDEKISSPQDLYNAVAKYKPEDKVTVTYLRSGKENTATATLGKNKNVTMNFSGSFPDMNFDGIFEGDEQDFHQFINKSPRPKVGFQVQDVEEGEGVKILEVKAETPAAKAGLQKNDIITEVNGNPLKNVDEIKKILASFKEGETLKVKYKRGNKSQTTEITLPKKLKTANL